MTFAELREYAESFGLTLVDDNGTFHLYDEDGNSDFSNTYSDLLAVEIELDYMADASPYDEPYDDILAQQELEDFEGIDYFRDAELYAEDYDYFDEGL